jgi:hypothetical protein
LTPGRLNELRCLCGRVRWVIDSDWRSDQGPMIPYAERTYRCTACGHNGPGWTLMQQSPPAFLLQPHPMYPMRQQEFGYWLEILRTHFPTSPLLGRLDEHSKTYVSIFQKAAQRLRAMIGRPDHPQA